MCPFSHGIAFRFKIGLCLLLLKVSGQGISYGHADIQNETWIHPSIQESLPQVPAQTTGKGGNRAELEPTLNARNLEESETMKQTIRPHALSSQRQKHRSRQNKAHRQSLLFTLFYNQHDSFGNSNYKQNTLEVPVEVNRRTSSPGGDMPGSSGQGPLYIEQHLEKHAAFTVKPCKTCGFKFGHKTPTISGQYPKHQALPSYSSYSIENVYSQDHRERNLRTRHFMLIHNSKSGLSSRRKRSPKKNRHVKLSRTSKQSSSKSSAKQKKPLKVNQGVRPTSNDAEVTVKPTTDRQPVSPTANTAQGLLQETDVRVLSRLVMSASKELLKIDGTSTTGRAIVDNEKQSVSAGLRQRPGTHAEFNWSTQNAYSSHEDSFVENGTYLGLDGKAVNLTELLTSLKRKEFQRQLNREAQWAYMCLVVLLCLMMWVMWYLGGLERCRYQPDDQVRFNDMQPKISVREILRSKQRYLPMFNEPEWEEVLMCNRGSDP